MATAEIRSEDFRERSMPMVCVVDGGPADAWYRFCVVRRAWWPLWLVLLGPVGLIVGLVLVAVLDRKVWGALPSTEAAQARLRRARRRNATLFAVTCVAVVAAVVGLSQVDAALAVAVGVAGMVAFGAAAAAAARPAGAPDLRLQPDGTIEVRHASGAFAEAYRTYRARLAADRRAVATDTLRDRSI